MTASIDETAALHQPSLPDRPRRDAEVTDLDKVRADRLVAAQQRREAARIRDLTALLRDRPDLVGAHAPADFAVDSVRWCV
jgi:hypothetical protein